MAKRRKTARKKVKKSVKAGLFGYVRHGVKIHHSSKVCEFCG